MELALEIQHLKAELATVGPATLVKHVRGEKTAYVLSVGANYLAAESIFDLVEIVQHMLDLLRNELPTE